MWDVLSSITRLLHTQRHPREGPLANGTPHHPHPVSLDTTRDGATTPTLKLVTYNCWGIPVAPHLEERFQGLVHNIATTDADVLCLQEVFTFWQKKLLQEAGERGGLQYFQAFNHGVGVPGLPAEGTGLVILSRYPILDCHFKRYSINGKPHKLLHADYYGYKGAGHVEIVVPGFGSVDVVTTHLHANYVDTVWHASRNSKDEYLATRVTQAWELAQFVNHTSRSRLTILAGDFNTIPSDVEWQLLQTQTTLSDAYSTHNSAVDDHVTYGSKVNTHSIPDWLPQRLDHVFFKSADAKVTLDSSTLINWKCGGGDSGMSVSDHDGVAAVFRLDGHGQDGTIEEPGTSDGSDMERAESVLTEARAIVNKAIATSHADRAAHLQRVRWEVGLLVLACVYVVMYYDLVILVGGHHDNDDVGNLHPNDCASTGYAAEFLIDTFAGNLKHKLVVAGVVLLIATLPVVIAIEVLMAHFVVKAEMLNFHHISTEMAYRLAKMMSYH